MASLQLVNSAHLAQAWHTRQAWSPRQKDRPGYQDLISWFRQSSACLCLPLSAPCQRLASACKEPWLEPPSSPSNSLPLVDRYAFLHSLDSGIPNLVPRRLPLIHHPGTRLSVRHADIPPFGDQRRDNPQPRTPRPVTGNGNGANPCATCACALLAAVCAVFGMDSAVVSYDCHNPTGDVICPGACIRRYT